MFVCKSNQMSNQIGRESSLGLLYVHIKSKYNNTTTYKYHNLKMGDCVCVFSIVHAVAMAQIVVSMFCAGRTSGGQ